MAICGENYGNLKLMSRKIIGESWSIPTADREPQCSGEETIYRKESRSLLDTSAVNSQTLSAKGIGSDAVPQLGVIMAL